MEENCSYICRVKKVFDFKLNIHSLYDLYLPIIGNTALSFYMLLAINSLCDYKNRSLVFSIDLISKNLGCSLQELMVARKKLEAMKLINTLICSINTKKLIFIVNNQLEFNSFMLNPKFKQLLLKQISDSAYEYLKYKYSLNSNLFAITNTLDISATFESVFTNNVLKKKNNIDFVYLYKKIIKSTSLNIKISNNCKQIIEDLYQKYAFSFEILEKLILDSIEKKDDNNFYCNSNFLISNSYKIINQLTNFSSFQLNRNAKLFESKLNTNDELKIINDYKLINSEQYLSLIYKNNLTMSQKGIISTLRKKFNLLGELINVIIDFSLFKTLGKLNKKYIFKVAQTINGLNINTCEQAINHFKNFTNNNNFKNANTYDNLSLESL